MPLTKYRQDWDGSFPSVTQLPSARISCPSFLPPLPFLSQSLPSLQFPGGTIFLLQDS